MVGVAVGSVVAGVPATTRPPIGVLPLPPVLIPPGREGSTSQTVVHAVPVAVQATRPAVSAAVPVVAVLAEDHVDASVRVPCPCAPPVLGGPPLRTGAAAPSPVLVPSVATPVACHSSSAILSPSFARNYLRQPLKPRNSVFQTIIRLSNDDSLSKPVELHVG